MQKLRLHRSISLVAMLHDRVSGLGDATNSLFLGNLSISVQCGAGALSGGFNQMRETQTLAFIIACISVSVCHLDALS
jgi:hypothetical protein